MRNQKLNPLLILTLFLFAFGCGKQQEKPQENASEATLEETAEDEIFHVLSFEGARENRYLVHFHGPDQGATIYTHDEVRILDLVPSETGYKYADDRLMIWLQDDDFIMEVDRKRVGPCQFSGLQPILAQAWFNGTEFWAVGNELSWNLVMGRERVVLMSDRGQTNLEFSGLKEGQLKPRSPMGTYEFENGTNKLKIEIIEGLCTNTMSGEPFAVSVRITLDDKEMTGCGTGLF